MVKESHSHLSCLASCGGHGGGCACSGVVAAGLPDTSRRVHADQGRGQPNFKLQLCRGGGQQGSGSLYGDNLAVEEHSAGTFAPVDDKRSVHIVEFYAPW